MRTGAGTIALLATLLAFTPARVHGQHSFTSVSLSLGVGSVWDGFRFDLVHRDFGFDPGYLPGHLYQGWTQPPARHYRKIRKRYYSFAPPCWDGWYGYDPYGFDFYGDCSLLGLHWTARDWRYRPRYRYPRSGIYVGIYWRDPYVAPWGPRWAYDPWGGYWDAWAGGYRTGWFDAVATGGYAGYGRAGSVPTRVVRASPSPLYRPGSTYKESPAGRSAQGRTATGRNASTAPGMDPGATRDATAPRSARPSTPSRVGTTPRTPTGVTGAPSSRRPSTGTGVQAPGRPTDRLSGGRDAAVPSRTPSGVTRGGTPGTSPRPTERAGLRPPDRSGTGTASPRRPDARMPAAGPSRPSAGRTPTRSEDPAPSTRRPPTRSGGAMPSTRGAPPRSSGPSASTRSTPSRPSGPAPSARSAPPRPSGPGPSARSVPTRSSGPAPSARSAPSRSRGGSGGTVESVPTRSRGGSPAPARRGGGGEDG